MFSHRQHLNKHSNSRLPRSLILPVHSPHMQMQHEINPKVTRLQVPSALQSPPRPTAKPCVGIKSTWGSKSPQTEGRGWLGGSGNGILHLSSPGGWLKLSPGERHLQSCYYTRAAQKPAGKEVVASIQPFADRCQTTCHSYTWHHGDVSKKAPRTDRAASIVSFTRSWVTLALLLFFGLRPRAVDRDA